MRARHLPKQWAHTRTTLRAQTKVQSPWSQTQKRQRRGSSFDRQRRRIDLGRSRHRLQGGWWRLRFGADDGRGGGGVNNSAHLNQKKKHQEKTYTLTNNVLALPNHRHNRRTRGDVLDERGVEGTSRQVGVVFFGKGVGRGEGFDTFV